MKLTYLMPYQEYYVVKAIGKIFKTWYNNNILNITPAILLTVASLQSFSQGFNGGFYFSGVTSQVDGDNRAGYNKFGIAGGIYTKFQLKKQWALSLSIGYIQKGARQVDKENIYNSYELRANYIELPVAIHYKPNFNKNLEPLSFALGLNNAILMNAKEDIGGGGFTEPYVALRKYNLSTQAEVFWELSKLLTAGLRMEYSMTPVREGEGNPTKTIWNKGQYHNVLMLSIYFTL